MIEENESIIPSEFMVDILRRKKTMKKHLVIILLLALLFVGCGGSEPATDDVEEAAVGEETAVEEAAPAEEMEDEGPVTLTISRWAGPHADDQIEVIKQFEEETGITVVVDAIDYGQLYQKQVLNMSGQTGGYDLVWAQEIWVPDYVGNDFLLPMNDFVDAGVVDGFDHGYLQSKLVSNQHLR